jgi:acetyl esterase
MPLDPQVQSVFDKLKQVGVRPLSELPIEQARKVNLNPDPGPAQAVENVEERFIPGPDREIGVRIYTPAGEGPFPALLYYHGGGWMLGDLETADVLCRQIANEVNCVVISVDYPLAPEHKFPAAAEDAFAAYMWVCDNPGLLNITSAAVTVSGDSAGANLAAVVALIARDRSVQLPLFQLLFCPVTNYAFDSQSYIDNAVGYGLTTETMKWFWSNYLNNPEDGSNPYASPLSASDLAGLPPAFIITAEYDPLRDDGEKYATRLKESGVPVEVTRYDGMVHGFYLASGVYDQAKVAVSQAIQALNRVFHA